MSARIVLCVGNVGTVQARCASNPFREDEKEEQVHFTKKILATGESKRMDATKGWRCAGREQVGFLNGGAGR